MHRWTIAFLISGFQVKGPPFRRGRVEFSEPAPSGSIEAENLRISAASAEFGFAVDKFSRAIVVEESVDQSSAVKMGRFEIDRTLDTLSFTKFGQSKFLPVGYVLDETSRYVALEHFETNRPMPFRPSLISEPVMEARWLFEEEPFFRHTDHLLKQPASTHSEAQRTLSAGLRWCRLGSLARGFSESVTVAFVMEWLALESMLLSHPKETTASALRRLAVLMRHWPIEIATNYTPSLRSVDIVSGHAAWQQLIAEMGEERRDIFHGLSSIHQQTLMHRFPGTRARARWGRWRPC